jgi:Skp family chaperone for outer membrane proteins
MFNRMFALVAVSIALTVGTRPLAAQEPPPPPTRIAVVNIGDVFRNYARLVDGQKEMVAALAPYKKAGEQLRDESNRLQKISTDPAASVDEKNDATKKLVAIRRQQEDMNLEAQKTVGKKNEQMLIAVYADLEAAVARHAEANQIDLVLTIGEPSGDERMKFANINRKVAAINTGGIVPLYIRPRVDITQAVLKILNDGYASKK